MTALPVKGRQPEEGDYFVLEILTQIR